MQQYQLKEDEVCLFESEVFEKESIKYYDLMLTNYNIVLCYTNRGKIKGKKAVVSTYPITEVKFYQERPFIKLDKNIVEVYIK